MHDLFPEEIELAEAEALELWAGAEGTGAAAGLEPDLELPPPESAGLTLEGAAPDAPFAVSEPGAVAGSELDLEDLELPSPEEALAAAGSGFSALEDDSLAGDDPAADLGLGSADDLDLGLEPDLDLDPGLEPDLDVDLSAELDLESPSLDPEVELSAAVGDDLGADLDADLDADLVAGFGSELSPEVDDVDPGAAFAAATSTSACLAYRKRASYYLALYRRTGRRIYLCYVYRFYAAYYCCLYRVTHRRRYLCLCYAWQARYQRCLYLATRRRRHLCWYYLYLARYYCCRYRLTGNRTDYLRCRRYAAAYRRCRG